MTHLPDDIRATIEAALRLIRPHMAVLDTLDGIVSNKNNVDAALTWLTAQPGEQPATDANAIIERLHQLAIASDDGVSVGVDDAIDVALEAWMDAQQPATAQESS